jgi:hypothetical protein
MAQAGERPGRWHHQRKERPVSIVSIGASAPTRAEGEAKAEATVEIHVDGRWDALALSEALVPFQSFLVQHTAERWVVHARAPGFHGETLGEALRAIADWQAERRLDAPVHVAGRHHGAAS